MKTKEQVLQNRRERTHKKRKCKSKESLKAVFSECNLKFIALCNLIKKETNLYNLDDDLFFYMFKQIMPDVYEMIY